ncbi:hydroxymethylglutaryl-CoA lyase [Aliiroseovarius lamellibrachiae]|uniref:hydroxymethylglutaryl-CoA lyase n=1 Tax=Aliiroseovarius lamellibrachiae TaxID=1924933 RepID=UPI001BE00CEA|nr:hydroxymethylglutaryl-CoA lyase [Aliiroseovarius lamellibrachiae]MBT2130904.1 hydroxymethylglutaryl-CoA lyase [Aliiroseovarius lamellibrachiae]
MDQIEIFEVGPRDGLQNEKRQIPTAEKIALVDLLSGAGFKRIEIASFVSPKWVPQMADSADVLAGITRAPGVSYAALTPNMRGFDGAMAAKADEIAIFGSASEGFSQANINCSIEESLERFKPIAEAAKVAKVKMRGYISCVTDCPYDGETAPEQVAWVAKKLIDMGCYEISLGDTIGQATPEKINKMLEAVLGVAGPKMFAGHYHDTSGRACDNIEASIAKGLRVFDAAVGGLGGCPYAPGAQGNVATEAVHDRVVSLGMTTGLDREILERGAEMARAMRIEG